MLYFATGKRCRPPVGYHLHILVGDLTEDSNLGQDAPVVCHPLAYPVILVRALSHYNYYITSQLEIQLKSVIITQPILCNTRLMARAGQTGITELHPNSQSYVFQGRYINLSALAQAAGVTPSAISKVFSGRNTPSLHTARILSIELDMSLDDFVAALSEHVYNKDTKSASKCAYQ